VVSVDITRKDEHARPRPIGRGTYAGSRPRPELAARPPGLGTLTGLAWHTEVALPATGTFTTPGKGSVFADAVLTAPDGGVPVPFVEVDRGTETDPPRLSSCTSSRF
jgi:hypothetical protein